MKYLLVPLALAMPIATPAEAKCQLGQIAELPVTMSGVRPMVPAKINGHETMFLADSGAFYSVITPGTAAELKLTKEAIPASLRGIGGEAAMAISTVKTFTLAGIDIPRVLFIVAGSEIGGSQLGNAGVLGQNVLGLADVEYDLAGGSIRLFKPRDCGQTLLEYWSPSYSMLDIEQPSGVLNRRTVGTAYLNGAKIHVLFDTGASSSILSLAAAGRAGVKPGDPGVTPAGESRGFGRGVVRSWIAPFASLKIGDEEIRKIRLRMGDIKLDDIDMLLGADFFLSHRVYVANSQHKLYFTYNGGAVFNLGNGQEAKAGPGSSPAQSADGRADPTDAEGFSRRGAALASRHELDKAIDDFTHAIALAPKEPRYFFQRATAHLENRQPLLGKADLDQALALKPDDVAALLVRARLHIVFHDRPSARIDLDAAARAATKEADQRLEIAAFYEAIDAFDQAIGQYDLWIASHRVDSRQADALNGRCWVRALSGKDLDKALADCNAALRQRSKTPAFLDSRGLVHLRQGDADAAIEDYDTALAARPRMAWSLYGRGLAKLRKGLKPEGQADIAVAVAIEADLPAKAKRYGITE